jgi:hypothetical protein
MFIGSSGWLTKQFRRQIDRSNLRLPNSHVAHLRTAQIHAVTDRVHSLNPCDLHIWIDVDESFSIGNAEIRGDTRPCERWQQHKQVEID